jgi:hypothetical protein
MTSKNKQTNEKLYCTTFACVVAFGLGLERRGVDLVDLSVSCTAAIHRSGCIWEDTSFLS